MRILLILILAVFLLGGVAFSVLSGVQPTREERLLAILAAVGLVVLIALPVLRRRPDRRRRRRSDPRPVRRIEVRRRPQPSPEGPARWEGSSDLILIDGSNVLHWRDETPMLDTLATVLRELMAQNFLPVIGFDANAGYLVEGQYLGPAAFARRLGLPADQVFVAPKGTPADPLLLDLSARTGAAIVTNDRYRDWIPQYPLLADPARLVRGRWADGTIMFLEPDRRAAAQAVA
jgi:hypothetical protein